MVGAAGSAALMSPPAAPPKYSYVLMVDKRGWRSLERAQVGLNTDYLRVHRCLPEVDVEKGSLVQVDPLGGPLPGMQGPSESSKVCSVTVICADQSNDGEGVDGTIKLSVLMKELVPIEENLYWLLFPLAPAARHEVLSCPNRVAILSVKEGDPVLYLGGPSAGQTSRPEVGVVQYVGPLHVPPKSSSPAGLSHGWHLHNGRRPLGTWIGVELLPENEGKGDCDGSYQGTQYFIAPQKSSVFTTIEFLRPYSPPRPQLSNENQLEEILSKFEKSRLENREKDSFLFRGQPNLPQEFKIYDPATRVQNLLSADMKGGGAIDFKDKGNSALSLQSLSSGGVPSAYSEKPCKGGMQADIRPGERVVWIDDFGCPNSGTVKKLGYPGHQHLAIVEFDDCIGEGQRPRSSTGGAKGSPGNSQISGRDAVLPLDNLIREENFGWANDYRSLSRNPIGSTSSPSVSKSPIKAPALGTSSIPAGPGHRPNRPGSSCSSSPCSSPSPVGTKAKNGGLTPSDRRALLTPDGRSLISTGLGPNSRLHKASSASPEYEAAVNNASPSSWSGPDLSPAPPPRGSAGSLRRSGQGTRVVATASGGDRRSSARFPDQRVPKNQGRTSALLQSRSGSSSFVGISQDDDDDRGEDDVDDEDDDTGPLGAPSTSEDLVTFKRSPEKAPSYDIDYIYSKPVKSNKVPRDRNISNGLDENRQPPALRDPYASESFCVQVDVHQSGRRTPAEEGVESDEYVLAEQHQQQSSRDASPLGRSSYPTVPSPSIQAAARGSSSGLCQKFDQVLDGDDRELSQVNGSVDHGSLVELHVNGEPRFGIVMWIGHLAKSDYCYNSSGSSSSNRTTSIKMAGIEMEDEVLGGGNGWYRGSHLFDCQEGKGVFVPFTHFRPDRRFDHGGGVQPYHANGSAVPAQHPGMASSSLGFFGDLDCPSVPGFQPPIRPDDMFKLFGRNRGIQGHQNSCYLDATLFSMFSFTSIFDSMLYRPANGQDIPRYGDVQKVLREEIVNPLRTNLFVRADKVMKLREFLDSLTSVKGLMSEEKDPEELLNSLLSQTLKVPPFLELAPSGQSAHMYQLFVERDDSRKLPPSVQELFEQSFLTSDIKLKRVPPVLILQMPRFGRQYKVYDKILPTQLLDVTDVIEGSPRQCIVCGKLASTECLQCFGDHGTGLDSTVFCQVCYNRAHNHVKRRHHKSRQLTVPEEFRQVWSSSGTAATPPSSTAAPRLYMELFAVVCIETSHYVSFVKCGSGPDAQWCFFDSMADRKGEQNGYNIPEVSGAPQVSRFFADQDIMSSAQLADSAKNENLVQVRRLVSDAYMCFYQSAEVMMYQ